MAKQEGKGRERERESFFVTVNTHTHSFLPEIVELIVLLCGGKFIVSTAKDRLSSPCAIRLGCSFKGIWGGGKRGDKEEIKGLVRA